ncbi:MAG: homocysteine S-methyltransferase family protein [Xanthomonadales bacterium]|nr:homocysteine S-methyltransferase family protein [Xanthomonadales bacterium]NIX12568.1 homocysteine S-methyltransferase family protein [Xanthomonadales bacterium]
MGQELINRGTGGHGVLWAAEALFASPQTVLDVHRDYITAGADVICTNTYSCIRNKFEPSGLADRLEEMNRLAVQLARQARDESGRDILVAGSLPPQKGSYRPDLVAADAELYDLYSEQAAFLADGVDFFICETMSTVSEARWAATAALETGKPVWVSWTLADDSPVRLRSGESLEAAYEAVRGLGVGALTVNCSTPEIVTQAVPALLEMAELPAGGYANGFTPIPEKWDYRGDHDLPPPRKDVGPEAYAAFAAQWIAAGARIVGGCCEIGPRHIRRLRELIGQV